jgi:hypothetical protein
MNRRSLIATVGAGVVGAVAGCSSNSEPEPETIAVGGDVNTHLSRAEQRIEIGYNQTEKQEWSQCRTAFSTAADEISAAETDVQTGLDQAQNVGSAEQQEALELLLESVRTLGNGVDELQEVCTEMDAGNAAVAERHAENATEYMNEYDEMAPEITQAFERLE